MVAPIITLVFAIALALVSFLPLLEDTGMEDAAAPVAEVSEDAAAEEAGE